MFKRGILAAALALIACGTGKHSHIDTTRPEAIGESDARKIAADFENGYGWVDVGNALNAIVTTAERRMHELGKDTEANKLDADWQTHYAFYFGALEPQDLGDHLPFSEYLVLLYQGLLLTLGQKECDFLHISDINVINFGAPVVFKPHEAERWCQEEHILHPDDTCMREYRRHFAGTRWQKDPDPDADTPIHDGLEPVVAYWITWGACEAATWGTGWVVICMPAGDLVEIASERWVAPWMSDKIWARENP